MQDFNIHIIFLLAYNFCSAKHEETRQVLRQEHGSATSRPSRKLTRQPDRSTDGHDGSQRSYTSNKEDNWIRRLRTKYVKQRATLRCVINYIRHTCKFFGLDEPLTLAGSNLGNSSNLISNKLRVFANQKYNSYFNNLIQMREHIYNRPRPSRLSPPLPNILKAAATPAAWLRIARSVGN